MSSKLVISCSQMTYSKFSITLDSKLSIVQNLYTQQLRLQLFDLLNKLNITTLFLNTSLITLPLSWAFRPNEDRMNRDRKHLEKLGSLFLSEFNLRVLLPNFLSSSLKSKNEQHGV